MSFPYPNQRFTTNLGLSLFGMDEVLADNMNLIDAAYGSGSSVNVNGSLVTSPNFNNTTPAAPAGKTNVIWQVDTNGNISAYATAGAGSTAWSALTGSLTVSQVVPWNSGFGIDTGISRISQGGLAIGNGTPGDESGALLLTELGIATGGAVNFFGLGSQILDNTGSTGNTNQFLSSGNGTGQVIWANAVTSVSFTGGLISVANPTTTPALTVAGTSGGIPYFSSASTWASSAVLLAGDFVLGGGAGSAPTASFSVVPIANGGTATGSLLTGIVRGGNPFTASEISGDATTSGSNALTLATVNSSPGTFTYATLTVNGKGLVTAASSGAAPGTVSSFSAGNLSPLFTTSVATPTTTPALSFSLSNAGAGTVFGNNGVSAGAPAYTISPVLGVPGASTGTIALASSTASGVYTLTAPANAATPTLTLPTTSNVLADQFAGDNVLYSNTPVGASAAGTLSLPTLLSQAANKVFAGPTSGGNAAPTFRSLVAADIPSGTVLWNQLGNAAGALTLANGTNATTFDQTSGALWTWANTTPSVTGNSTTVALSTSVAPTNLSGNSWVYTLGGVTIGANANAWAGASVTISGYTGGATGNNGTSLLITASTATTVTITNATGTTTNTGTPVMISTAVVQSPGIVLAGTINAGIAGSLVSTVDSWTIQTGTMKTTANNPAPTGPNPVSVLMFSHTGSSGTAYVQVPNIQGLPSTDLNIDLMENGGNVLFTTEGGTNQGGSITLGAGPGSFGIKGQLASKTTFVEGNTMATAVPCIALSSTAACTLTSGTGICVAIGSGGGAGNPGTDTFTFNPASGTAAFQCLLINPTIKGTSSGATTALLVNPTATLTNLSGTNLLLDLQSGGVSKHSVDYTGHTTLGTVGTTQGLLTLGATANSGGTISSTGNAFLFSPASTSQSANPTFVIDNAANGNGAAGAEIGSAATWSWSSNGNANGTSDTSIGRVSAGIINVGTGAQASVAGSIQCASIALNGAVASPTAGVYYSGGTAGVSAGPFAAITSIQTVGGIVTVLADVSDERLKDHTPYTGGLKEILSITPIKYTWNTAGQKITGFSEDRTFVGFRAQDVQKAIPEAVTQSASNAEYLGLDDRPVIAALVNSIKELSASIARIEALLNV